MSTMALEVAPFCTRVLAPFYLRVSIHDHKLALLHESVMGSISSNLVFLTA